MNEALIFRHAEADVTLYYTKEAAADAVAGRIRRFSRCLKNDYCLMWRLTPEGAPVWTSICLVRALVRYFKGLPQPRHPAVRSGRLLLHA